MPAGPAPTTMASAAFGNGISGVGDGSDLADSSGLRAGPSRCRDGRGCRATGGEGECGVCTGRELTHCRVATLDRDRLHHGLVNDCISDGG